MRICSTLLSHYEARKIISFYDFHNIKALTIHVMEFILITRNVITLVGILITLINSIIL